MQRYSSERCGAKPNEPIARRAVGGHSSIRADSIGKFVLFVGWTGEFLYVLILCCTGTLGRLTTYDVYERWLKAKSCLNIDQRSAS